MRKTFRDGSKVLCISGFAGIRVEVVAEEGYSGAIVDSNVETQFSFDGEGRLVLSPVSSGETTPGVRIGGNVSGDTVNIGGTQIFQGNASFSGGQSRVSATPPAEKVVNVIVPSGTMIHVQGSRNVIHNDETFVSTETFTTAAQ